MHYISPYFHPNFDRRLFIYTDNYINVIMVRTQKQVILLDFFLDDPIQLSSMPF